MGLLGFLTTFVVSLYLIPVAVDIALTLHQEGHLANFILGSGQPPQLRLPHAGVSAETGRFLTRFVEVRDRAVLSALAPVSNALARIEHAVLLFVAAFAVAWWVAYGAGWRKARA